MKFIVIGITDHPQPFFPPEVLEIIRRGRVFSGGKRHHEIVAPLLPGNALWIDITVPLEKVFGAYKEQAGSTAAPQPQNHAEALPYITVFASGDPLFFGFANTIRREMPEAEIVLYPSFNSLQMLAHRLVMPYHDMRVISLTGRPWPEFDRALIERAEKVGILTDREHTPATIARRMLDYGYTGYTMHVGEHLGNPSRERVTTLTTEEAAVRDFAHPNCIILESTRQQPRRPFGLPDSSFALLDGREKMITKMPIRLLALQALDLPCRHVLWDIGFCTGSVSIEARLQFPHLHVVAFEIRPECETIIKANARHHGAPGIDIRMGDFLTADCDDIATPDAVFIGGHGGRLKDIMAKVLRHLSPDGVIVFNSVKVKSANHAGGNQHSPAPLRTDSRQLWDEACSELGLIQAPPLRIELNDHNPIEILKAQKP